MLYNVICWRLIGAYNHPVAAQPVNIYNIKTIFRDCYKFLSLYKVYKYINKILMNNSKHINPKGGDEDIIMFQDDIHYRN